jgi:hypothetical protein
MFGGNTRVAMPTRLRPSPAMVVALIALFASLSGIAWAANTVGSGDVIDNSLQSVDLKDNAAVKSADVVNDTVVGGGLAAADLKSGSVGTSEVAADSLGAGDLAPGSVGSSEVANDSLTGADVSEATLGEVPSALLGGTGRFASDSDPSFCDPNSGTFVTCVYTPYVTLAPSRVLVTAAATAHGTSNGGVGVCKLGKSSFGEIAGTSRTVSVVNGRSFFSLVGITDPLPAGTYAFGLDCNETSGYPIYYSDEQIAAVALSPN